MRERWVAGTPAGERHNPSPREDVRMMQIPVMNHVHLLYSFMMEN